jgi:hypothetical protein
VEVFAPPARGERPAPISCELRNCRLGVQARPALLMRTTPIVERMTYQPLYEFVSFLGKLNPVRVAARDHNPLLHYSSAAGIEALARTAAYEFVDPFLRKLYNKLTIRRQHREDLAIHLESAEAEAFLALPDHMPVLGEGLHDRREPRINFSYVRSLRFLPSHKLPLAA